MKRLADFLVDKNKIIFAVVLALTAVSILMMSKVNVITDMTEYLPDDSPMKIGIDRMKKQFPESSMDDTTVRVMFEGLPDDRKEPLADELEKIRYVDGVEYDVDDEDYNKSYKHHAYTLYELTVPYKDTSDETKAVKEALDQAYIDKETYNAEYQISNSSSKDVPFVGIAIGVLILIAILFVLCPSWIEPFLFLITIGIAVMLNMGSNALLPRVSDTTHSITAILQLVLSMDYSIILMNQYRREIQLTPDRRLAMKNTLQHVFTAISSSALTTIVGMIMLVFMSFKIGQDLGFVLAKGVLLSMICVFTVLPTLILLFDKWIFKFGKKVPHPPMKPLAGFSFKCRYAIVPLLIFLFFAAFMLKGNTPITYINTETTKIDEVFPDLNRTVMLYETAKEDKAAELFEQLEKNKHVDSVMSYPTTIGKKFTAEDLKDELEDMDDFTSGDMKLTDDVMRMLYYYHFTKGETGTITASELLNFIADDVLENEAFADEMDTSARGNRGMMKKIANKDNLTTPLTAAEISDFFEMDGSQTGDLYLYYFIKKGGIPTGEMTVKALVDFILDDVAKDPDYSSQFDAATIKQMKQLRAYTDVQNISKKRSYKSMAKELSMKTGKAKLLYAQYFSQQKKVKTGSKTFPELVSFLTGDVLKNKELSSRMDSSQKKQLRSLSHYADKGEITKQRTAAELAQAFSMKESDVVNLFMLKLSSQMGAGQQGAGTGGAQQGAGQQAGGAAGQQGAGTGGAQQGAGRQAAGGAGQMSPEEMAKMQQEAAAKMQQEAMKQLQQAAANMTMSEYEFVSFLLSDVVTNKQYAAMFDKEAVANLNRLKSMMDLTLSGEKLDAGAAAKLFSMEKSNMEMLYYYSIMDRRTKKDKLSIHEVVSYILDNKKAFSSSMSKSELSKLAMLKKIMDSSVKMTRYSANGMADLLGMSKEQARMLYTLKLYKTGNTEDWRMSPSQFIHFLNDDVLSDPSLADRIDADSRDDLKSGVKLVDAILSDQLYTPGEMAKLMNALGGGTDRDQLELLYIYYFSKHNYNSLWQMSIMEFIDCLNNEAVKDPRFADFFEAKTKTDLADAADQVHDAFEQLHGADYSLALISTDLPPESKETFSFIRGLRNDSNDSLGKDAYYLIGNSAMATEMADSFRSELNKITILTALAIFLVVLLAFRRFSVPIILVLLIQTAVYITMTSMWLRHLDINYLALLIVQSILMGATIDYGILYTNQYRESRKTADIRTSLLTAYNNSIHTIMTSGLILILVTLIMSHVFVDLTVREICATISIGSLTAVIMILLILPGTLAALDRLVCGKQKTSGRAGGDDSDAFHVS